MKILAKRNGIALLAVLAILLVLTMLIPAMFSMSDNAVKSAMEGTDAQRAAYLARTMIEMTVAAFEDTYDDAEDNPYGPQGAVLTKFYEQFKSMDAQRLYMYRVDSVEFPTEPKRIDFVNDDAFNTAYAEYEAKLETYEKTGIIYTTSDTAPSGCSYVGYSDCHITYDDEATYYAIDADGNTEVIDADEYSGGVEALENLINNGVDVSAATKYVKIQNKNIIFNSSAKVNGKAGYRRCVLVLPTKPSEEYWITPANLEVGCNQIFPNSDAATGRTNIQYDSGLFVDGSALKQPLYIFSCVGNMVISDENLMVSRPNSSGTMEQITYIEYLRENNASYRQQDMTFGLHPETGTREPDNDPTFSCLRTYNMRSWHDDAQLDNFVAYTATNAIQVDLPVNLIVNPSRTGRIGDGIDKNYSLYKVLIFQAPTIVFNETVSSFISLQTNNVKTAGISLYPASPVYRMTSIMLAAPVSTPYSYLNGSRGKTVKAGKVYFAEDVYIWVVPYNEDGSNYETQTVYYKNKDIVLYKIANAGDIYYFNSEVPVTVNGKDTTTGFSLTGYFMDVIYNEHAENFNNNKWWQVWSNAKALLFNNLLERFHEPIFMKDDFKWIGNARSGTGDRLPVVDDFYVIWDS